MLSEQTYCTETWRKRMAEFKQGDSPSDHSVDEVNAYLADPSVSAEEKAAVYDAEMGEGGKQRTTVKAPATGGQDAHNQTPVSDETVTDGTADEAEETRSAYQDQGSKPYWYEETQGPAPEGAEKTYTVVKVADTSV